MICGKCGEKIPDNAPFCPNCESRVNHQAVADRDVASDSRTHGAPSPESQRHDESRHESHMSKQDVFKRLAEEFDGKIQSAGHHTIIEGRYRDSDVRLEYFPAEHSTRGAETSPPKFLIAISKKSDITVEIRREGVFDIASKAVKLTREVQTGDEAFDNTFFIDTNHPKYASEFLTTPEARHQIIEIYKSIPKTLSTGVFSTGLGTMFIVRDPWKNVNADLVRHTLDQLRVLFGMLPTGTFQKDAVEEKQARNIWRFIKISLCVLGFGWASQFILIFIPVYQTVDMAYAKFALLLSIPAFILFMRRVAVRIRGTSKSGWAFLALSLLSLLGLPFCGMTVLQIGNGILDRSLGIVVQANVDNIQYEDYQQCTIDAICLFHGKKELSISAGQASCHLLKKGDTIDVWLKPGRFGFEWIQSYRKTPIH